MSYPVQVRQGRARLGRPQIIAKSGERLFSPGGQRIAASLAGKRPMDSGILSLEVRVLGFGIVPFRWVKVARLPALIAARSL
jgi:hypothetical protein